MSSRSINNHGAGLLSSLPIGNGQIDLTLGLYPAAILHPSLGCPLIVEEPACVSLFIVADRNFRQAFLQGNGFDAGVGATGGENIRLIINQHLKIHPWEEASQNQKDLGRMDQTLVGDDYAEKIACYYLGPLGEEVRDKSGRHFANLRTSTRSQFATLQLKELFQVELGRYPFAPATLYDAFWTVRNERPHETDPHKEFLDLQDRLVRQYIQATFRNNRDDVSPEGMVAKGPRHAYKVDENGIDFKEIDPSVPVIQHHPIYVPPAGKRALTLGHIGDLHLSSRQHAYKGNRAAVIPGVSETISPPLGELSNNNADNCIDLLNQVGKEIDLLLIAGDLYDHLRNFDPASKETSTTGKLWEAMYFTGEKDLLSRTDEYPYGIDALAAYSLLMHYYNSHRKPVLVISGNHEAYRYPYGISPRIPLKGKVNDGIPLDHNLTFYEAILLYGPGYAATIPPALTQAVKPNFHSSHFDWFYTVFTPLADYVVPWNDQCLLCLEWGDDESYKRSTLLGGGPLPRAGEGGSKAQIRLGAAALALGRKINILSTHYTLINYEPKEPLNKEGEITFTDAPLSSFTPANYSLFDYGSAMGNRQTLYGDWLSNNRFSYMLAGHAHRIALYQVANSRLPAPSPTNLLDSGNRIQESTMEIHAGEISKTLRTRGYLPDRVDLSQGDWCRRTKVIVSSSAGCMAKQNLEGELNGRGVDYPAATILSFEGTRERIRVLRAREDKCKPRFAVACDYIDIMDDGFWESFNGTATPGVFQLKPYWEKIHPSLSRTVKESFLKSATLYLIINDSAEKFDGTKGQLLSGNEVNLTFSASLINTLQFKKNEVQASFISLVFDGDAVKHLPGFTDYDFTSPWNIQVEIYNRRYEEDLEMLGKTGSFSGYSGGAAIVQTHSQLLKRKNEYRPEDLAIRRDNDHGEIPDHKRLAKEWPGEYKYQLTIEDK